MNKLCKKGPVMPMERSLRFSELKTWFMWSSSGTSLEMFRVVVSPAFKIRILSYLSY